MNSAAPHPLSPAETEDLQTQLASLCKAAADSLRLRILRVLRHDAMDVSELCAVLDVRQPALSHHLKLMSAAGLLCSQRDGNHIFYRRQELGVDEPFAALQQALLAAADTLELDRNEEARREELQRQREQNSLDFFTNNVSRFREQQDLIAAPERYASAVNSLLNALPVTRRKTALEVGPGDGWLLPRLCGQFDRVVALDNAPAMLDSARATAAALDNIEFVLGDTRHEVLSSLRADLIVINMVLHHTPDPATTLREAASALAPGGVLLITELCEHQQGWARENCGDLWLGFAPELLGDWAAAAGLKELTGSYLGQRNGFKLQLRLFGAAKNTS
ncbi:ArsR/SmtB family transcription factor [Congregibacter litoralis]|uniref:Transcriptional regulator, ArsR family n=1 Tax=Congregibacter litoralis KT71 TaxID=314285 RepID=A4ABV4_9GAMM|nr:metalloregulator ArsR/SmtB family transcription factor [Congregibacter litoralis]EAQ96404.1 transcriptional regulator, ArsR family [Congregibacter litoralis KT71]